MRGIRPTACLIVVVFSVNAFGQPGVEIRSAAAGSLSAVAAGRKTAVAAGIEILGRGGNAVDAAAATILVQSVVKSRSFCFGGDGLWFGDGEYLMMRNVSRFWDSSAGAPVTPMFAAGEPTQIPLLTHVAST